MVPNSKKIAESFGVFGLSFSFVFMQLLIVEVVNLGTNFILRLLLQPWSKFPPRLGLNSRYNPKFLAEDPMAGIIYSVNSLWRFKNLYFFFKKKKQLYYYLKKTNFLVQNGPNTFFNERINTYFVSSINNSQGLDYLKRIES